jgi:hypothetical protein
MYGFGVVVLLALAVYAVASIVNRNVQVAREFVAATHVLLGLGAAWLANVNLFNMWAAPVRNHGIGVILTGMAIGGFAIVWREGVEFMAGLERKFHDEAETLEKAEGIHRVA